MPEQQPPNNFAQMLTALKQSFDEDAEAVFQMSDAEVAKALQEEGIDPEPTVSKVKKVVQEARAKAKKPDKPKVFIGHRKAFWDHPSVLRLNSDDPVTEILNRAERFVLNAMQAGWSGPPFDPIKLAKLNGIDVAPASDVPEARIVPLRQKNYRIEINPDKTLTRTRFSVAHELAHSLFDDCGEVIRNRLSKENQRESDWQLEMLCNLAASEFLMPFADFSEVKSTEADINKILQLQRTYQVSAESVLLRLARLTEFECLVFTASQRAKNRFSIDYSVPSRSWRHFIAPGTTLPANTCCNGCTSIGFTARSTEEWLPEIGKFDVQCLRVSPLPNANLPRIAGFIKPVLPTTAALRRLNILRGDATEPRGLGVKVVAHVVNDKAPNWGRGFGFAVKQKWPEAQRRFREWAITSPRSFSLGNVFHSEVSPESLFVFQMICQHGYGPSPTPRLRYLILKSCLENLAKFAIEKGASVHMPKIGVGEAGGSWQLIQQMIDETLCARGIDVTIYELPSGSYRQPPQRTLFD